MFRVSSGPLAKKKRRVVEVSDSHPAYQFTGSTWGHISSVSDPSVLPKSESVEDEDLTELDTFGGVLRSSIDDPVQAFLKVRGSAEDPDLMPRK